MPCEGRGRDQSYAATSQRAPGAKRGEKDLPLVLQRELGLANTLILDASLQNLLSRETISFCCFKLFVCGTLLWQVQETNVLTYLAFSPHPPIYFKTNHRYCIRIRLTLNIVFFYFFQNHPPLAKILTRFTFSSLCYKKQQVSGFWLFSIPVPYQLQTIYIHIPRGSQIPIKVMGSLFSSLLKE